MSAPKILAATETTFTLDGKPFPYTFSGNTNVLAKCVDLTIESYHRRSQKMNSRMEYHTVDATREIVSLFDHGGNVWGILDIRHTVDLVRHCQECGADNADRCVIGRIETTSPGAELTPVGKTLCNDCRQRYIAERVDVGWLCSRINYMRVVRFDKNN